jgi:hypothetical protein
VACQYQNSYYVSEHTRVCSLHFVGGEKTPEHSVPTIFPWSQQKPQRKPPSRLPLPEPPVRSECDDVEAEQDEREREIQRWRKEIQCLKRERELVVLVWSGLWEMMNNVDFTLGSLHTRYCV